MFSLTVLLTFLGASSVLGVPNPHYAIPQKSKQPEHAGTVIPKNGTSHQHLNKKTKKFAVKGTAIPEVDFDVGESYAGTLSISNNPKDQNALFFWFFPSSNPAATDEITIWLNGGPGISSLEGLLQENGPFLWQEGTYKPIPNSYSWTNLTNMVWIDNPIGTGFSTYAKDAPKNVTDEQRVAKDFAGFWKNFVNTFDLKGRKVYLTGESYAGQMIPYIAEYMLEANQTEYYDVKGVQLIDPTINWGDTLMQAPAAWMVNYYDNLFNLNETSMAYLNYQNVECGYDEFMRNALTFPPKGPLPTAPDSTRDGCDLWTESIIAAIYVNPCFNVYHITDYCPYLWNVIGGTSLGWGPRNYFNRSDVQHVLNVRPTNFILQGDPELGLSTDPGDTSPPSGLGPLPSIIETTNNVIIANGLLDYLIIANGTLATIQNMTWNGKQGFQEQPSSPFFVPYHSGIDLDIAQIASQPAEIIPITNVAGSGHLGVTHTERGLTFVTVKLAGHELPQYQPGAAYRMLEFLLSRVDSLTGEGEFSTPI